MHEIYLFKIPETLDFIIKTALYHYYDTFPCWRIEEYFRFKKQAYNFENFRVRNLKAINNLNQLLTYALGFVAMLSDQVGSNNLSDKMIKNSKSLRSKVLFHSYQIAKGIANTLAYARSGIKAWQKIRRAKPHQQL